VEEQDLFNREILSVTELTRQLSDVIESRFGPLWLAGEISNFRRPSSGHLYFVLKDADCQIRAVMFRTKMRYLGFEPADGQEVLARGRLSVYGARGEYQIVIEYMEPRGEGALRLAFEKLKSRLAAEGLFDQDRKKPIPYLPRRVAIVTSPTSAAIRDFVRVSRRRFENAGLFIYPVRVQGDEAPGEIAAAVRDINQWGNFDLIVLTRGGGSLEDLWAFNEEIVARAVADSQIPVVSAVGHEVDFTIADFVADLRAPTPSAAAELIFREKRELQAHLAGAAARLYGTVRGRIQLARERLAHVATRMGEPDRHLAERRMQLDERLADLLHLESDIIDSKRQILRDADSHLKTLSPKARLHVNRVKLENLNRDLVRSAPLAVRRRRERLAGLSARLGDLSPLTVLERGYAVARKRPEMTPLKSSSEITKGNRLNLLLAQGELEVTVDEVTR
jgi:exodeoxyribonuclease VII large subunit